MNNTLELLVGMHEQIEKIIANENVKNKAITEKADLLKEVMTEEIVNDLRELKSYRKKLGIEKNVFDTNILLKSNKRSGVVRINFISTGIYIVLYNKHDDTAVVLFELNKEYNVKHWRFKCCNVIYSHWEDIKKQIEKQFIESYFKEQKDKCIQIGEERQETINELIELLKARGVITTNI